jgi:hypothetical protein
MTTTALQRSTLKAVVDALTLHQQLDLTPLILHLPLIIAFISTDDMP